MALLTFYLLLALVVSFICSISESVLLSVRPTYVAVLEKEGRASAATLKKLRDNLDRPLAAILTANTIAHTVGAAGVGAQAAVVFGNNYVGATSAILTLLILIFSEIIPKTLGATYWRQLAPSFAVIINAMMVVLFPFVWMSEKITGLLSGRNAHVFTFSRDEMEAMAGLAAKEGLLEAKELRIVQNLMRLHSLCISDIMTPRPVVFAVPDKMTVEEFFSQHSEQPFTRIPVYGANRDDVTGYILKSDLLLAQARDNSGKPLAAFARELPVILETYSASRTFDLLMHGKDHMALVVDEYGTMQGLVTLEDVIETLIGLEITDELDRVEDMQQLARQRWRERMKAIGVNPDAVESETP